MDIDKIIGRFPIEIKTEILDTNLNGRLMKKIVVYIPA